MKRLLLVSTLLLLAATACEAQTPDASGFALGRDYTLDSGSQLEGDQVIVAYEASLETSSHITGDLTLTANKVAFDATVDGDAVIVADNLALGDNTHITGDLVICVQDLARDDLARIDGEVREECDRSSRVSVSNLVDSVWDTWRGGWFYRVSTAIWGALLFGALAALGTVFFPRPLIRMSETMRRHLFATGSVGCLTILVVIGLTTVYIFALFLLVFPLVLLPLVMLAWLIVILFSVLGWMALAEPSGILLLTMLRVSRQPRMINAAVGGIALALLLRVWSIFWFTAWIGLLITAVLGAIGLGAVLLTRIGTRPYHPAAQ